MKYLTMILFCVIMSACAQVADKNRLKGGDLVTFVQIPELEGQVMFCGDYFGSGRLCKVRYVEHGIMVVGEFKPFELRRK